VLNNGHIFAAIRCENSDS